MTTHPTVATTIPKTQEIQIRRLRSAASFVCSSVITHLLQSPVALRPLRRSRIVIAANSINSATNSENTAASTRGSSNPCSAAVSGTNRATASQ
jgi:hypothetical protein